MTACRVVLAAALLVFVAHSVRAADGPAEGDKPSPAELRRQRREALEKERKQIETQFRAMVVQGQEMRDEQNRYRGEIKKEAMKHDSVFDMVSDDEEAVKLVARMRELQAELDTVKKALKQRLDDHPVVKAREARVKTLNEKMLSARSSGRELLKEQMGLAGRLEQIKKELQDLDAEAAAEAAKASEAPKETDNDDS